MIVAERKPLPEIMEMTQGFARILVMGCKGCVTVCNTGGLKEVEILASLLRIARGQQNTSAEVGERLLERQCDPEYIEQVADEIGQYDAVVSLACGVGPQFLSEAYPDSRIFPGVNTTFMGGGLPTVSGKSAVPAAVTALFIALTACAPSPAAPKA